MSFGKRGAPSGQNRQAAPQPMSGADLAEIPRAKAKPASKGSASFVAIGAVLCLCAFMVPISMTYAGPLMSRFFGPDLPYDPNYLSGEPSVTERSYKRATEYPSDKEIMRALLYKDYRNKESVARVDAIEKTAAYKSNVLRRRGPIEFNMQIVASADDKTTIAPIDAHLFETCVRPLGNFPYDASIHERKLLMLRDDASKFLECTGKTLKSRLCQSDYRKRFASRLAKMERMTARRMAAAERLNNSNSITAVGIRTAEKNIAMMHGDSDDASLNSGIETPLGIAPSITPGLAQTIRELSSVGLLAEGDFAWGNVPETIAPHLVQAEKDVCGS